MHPNKIKINDSEHKTGSIWKLKDEVFMIVLLQSNEYSLICLNTGTMKVVTTKGKSKIIQILESDGYQKIYNVTIDSNG